MKLPIFQSIGLVISFIIAISCSKEDFPPTRGLILYYTFDGNIVDISSYHNNGINNTSSKYVSGKWDKALEFNGISDYIELSDTINSENGLSFSFWIKSRGAVGTENNGSIISKYNMTTHQRCFMIYSFGAYETRSDNRLSASFYKYGNSSAIHDMTKSYLEPGELNVYPDPSLWTISNPKRLVVGKWTHCVVNVTSLSIEIWIDGVLCTEKKREYNRYFNSHDEPIFIGNNPAVGEGSNNHFNGIIDELRIYNRGLTTEEIQILFRVK